MACRSYGNEVKGPADFSGYWRLAKTENFDVFLQDLGFPWVVRKAATKFAGSAIDVISHTGSVMCVTSLNAKGSWTRSYDTSKEVTQKNAEGVVCKTTAWWEGKVFRSRMEGPVTRVCESSRYMRGGIMVVRTSVKLDSGAEATMFWYFEMMEVLHRHLGGQGRNHLLRRIQRDQRQVEKATQRDNAYLQIVVLDFDRWSSPADEFIHVVVSPSYSRSRLKLPLGSGGGGLGSPHVSQGNLSKSPSASSLGSPLDMRSDGRSGRSEVGSRSRLGSESTSALDKASIADLARADKMVAAAAAAAAQRPNSGRPPQHPQRTTSAAADAASSGGPASPTAAAPPQAAAAAGQALAAGEGGGHPHEFCREISLSFRSSSEQQPAAGGPTVEGGPPHLHPLRPHPGSSSTEEDSGVTFQPSGPLDQPGSPTSLRALSVGAGSAAGPAQAQRAGGSTTSTGGGLGQLSVASGGASDHGMLGNAVPSDHATAGSASAAGDAAELGPGSGVGSGPGPSQPGHARVASAGSLSGVPAAVRAGAAYHHRRNLSGEGVVDSEGRPSLRPTPRSTPTHRQMPTNGEQLLAFKAHEYLDSRGITTVVPVATPNDTSEPQLLCMSPEQAEQTHAKLRELEEEMLLQRQEYRKGVTCCGCFVVSWVSSSLPDHLRTWEMSVS